MANYIKGEKNYYPDIKPFTPDYKFLSATLDARENKYLAGWEATNDLYSRVYSDLSHSENQQFQQQFIENLAPELSKISGLDLSLQTNVVAAQSVFAPFFEDEAVVKDIVYTSTYKREMNRANQFANSPDQNVRELYNPVGVKNMQYRMKEFQDADRNQLINMPLPKYVEDADLTQYAQNYLRSLGLEGKGFTQKKDHFTMQPGADGILGTPDDRVANRWIITDTNGKLIEGDAYRRVMTDLTDDPRVQEFYDAKAYVASMEFAEQGMTNGSTNSMNQGITMWAQSEVERVALLNSERYNTLDQEIQSIAQQTTSWGNFGQLNGLTPAEENQISQSLSEAEQLKVNLEELLKVNQFTNTPDQDDQALISKAYSLNKNYNIAQDLQSAAYNYSRENAETTIRENEYVLAEDKNKFQLQQIAAKYQADKLLKDQQGDIDAKLKVLQGQIDGQKNQESLTDGARNDGFIDYSDPGAAIFSIKDDNIDSDYTPFEVNADEIANDGFAILNEKASIISDMLAARYPDQKKFTITLGGEEMTLSPKDIADRLSKKKDIIDGTQVTQNPDALQYESDIMRIFEEQANWFKDKDAVLAQRSPDYIKQGGSYSDMYLRLFGNDPNNPEALGLDLREDLYLRRLEKYQRELYDKGSAAIVVAREENEWVDEMVKAGYPLPYNEVEGVKNYMTLPEYQKKFRELALSGKIKNFDVSGVGFNPQNAGTSNPDWMTTRNEGSFKSGTQRTVTIIDEIAISGRSKALWEAITTGVNKSYNTIGGDSYLSLTRGYDPNTPFADIGFVPTQTATGNANPDAGTTMDRLLGMALNQFASSTQDPTTRVSVIPSPQEISDFDAFDIEAGPDVDESENLIAAKIFNSLQNEALKGEFSVTYYPNLGANRVDGELRNAMGGYKIHNFSPAFKQEIKNLYKDDAESYSEWNSVMNDGVMMIYDRTGGRDVNPNNLNRIQGSSFIEQNMNLSNDQSYTYEDVTNTKAGFSPGKITFQDLGGGRISITGYRHVYNPLSKDISKQYTVVPINTGNIVKAGNLNFSADLNTRFKQTQQQFAELDRLNNLHIYQIRAQNLTKAKFIENYMVDNPGATQEVAADMYKRAKAFKPE